MFNKTNGLSTVFKLVLNKKTKLDVRQKALFTLGNAVLQSGRQLCSILMSKNKIIFHVSESDSFSRTIFDLLTPFMGLVSFYTT